VDAIELRPGVAFCLRRFHVLITELVRGVWIQYIRKVNATVLGSTTDISEFLFGSERSDLSVLRPMLSDLQAGRCFYCDHSMGGAADVDHFIPWSRYPVDLGHNFVLAHRTCNGAKGSMLAAEDHLARWAERNRRYGDAIGSEYGRVNFIHDLAASTQIARWAYEQTFAAGALTWIGGKRVAALGSTAWAVLLR
jgi:5-methylcytosine-specific restriction endonuclease McrA